jgi:hypothetical protein
MHLRVISNDKKLKGYEGALSSPLELLPWAAGIRWSGPYDRLFL